VSSWFTRPSAIETASKPDALLLPAPVEGLVGNSLSRMQVRVYFEDTDSGQIVYHANFLRFIERGRTNYLRLLGTNQQALLQEAWNNAFGFTS
jgi:acyl-CoA thioester hydrolase